MNWSFTLEMGVVLYWVFHVSFNRTSLVIKLTVPCMLCQGEDQQPQPKKKLKKKAGAVAAPSFPSLSQVPIRRKDSTITQPKCSSFATPKQFSNLGKNFR